MTRGSGEYGIPTLTVTWQHAIKSILWRENAASQSKRQTREWVPAASAAWVGVVRGEARSDRFADSEPRADTEVHVADPCHSAQLGGEPHQCERVSAAAQQRMRASADNGRLCIL